MFNIYYYNGSNVTGAEATGTGNLAFSTIVTVQPSCRIVNNQVVLTLTATGTLTNANMTVVRL